MLSWASCFLRGPGPALRRQGHTTPGRACVVCGIYCQNTSIMRVCRIHVCVVTGREAAWSRLKSPELETAQPPQGPGSEWKQRPPGGGSGKLGPEHHVEESKKAECFWECGVPG